MRFRKLRIAWSVFSALACVLLIVLWVRSYYWVEAVRFMDTAKTRVLQCVSMPGRFAIGTINLPQPWSTFRMSAAEWKRDMANGQPEVPSAMLGGWLNNQAVAQLFIPYWMLTFLALFVGYVPWISRFTVRTLLIAMTLVAVVLGLAVWLSTK